MQLSFYRLRAFQEGPGDDPVVSSGAGPHRCGRRAAANLQGIQKGGAGHRSRRQRRGNDEALQRNFQYPVMMCSPRSEPLRLRAMGFYLEEACKLNLVKRKVSSKRKLMAKHRAR